VSFELVGPWSPAPREPGDADDESNRFVTPVLVLVLVVLAVVLARQNLKSGRADRRGAHRVGAVLFFTYASFWLLLPHLSNLDQEMSRLFMYLGVGLFVGGVMYLVYLAIEPFVRRSWPTMLVGWSRALAGRLPDPVVGRDLLIGVVSGLLLSALDILGVLAPELMGSSQAAMPMRPEISVLEHNRYFLLTIASTLNNGLQNALLTVMMFTVLREIVKRGLMRLSRKWLSPDYVAAAIALTFLVFLGTVNNENGQTNFGMLVLLQLVSSGVFLIVLLRFGLFATVVMYSVNALAVRTPLTLQSTAIYAGPAWVMLGLIFAIAVLGFWMARRTEELYPTNR
jgi:hypothetical protein